MKLFRWWSVSVLFCAMSACAASGGAYIDDEGVFVSTESALDKSVAYPQPNRSIEQIETIRTAGKAVRCRLIDYIDCTAENTHEFDDNGGSRVLDLPSGKFRVTAPAKGFELNWFRYSFKTANKAGTPHLLVVESSNDQERYTTASVTAPEEGVWAPPFEGAEKTSVDGFPLYMSPWWYQADVGLDVYTGRELPLDGKSFRWHYVFYPKCDKMKLTISSSGWAKDRDEKTGAAVSRVWIYEILDELGDHAPKIASPKSDKRHLGLYVTHPFHFIAHYGMPPFDKAQRRKSFENMFDLMQFCGMNMLQFNAINGSDRAGRAWYPSDYYKQCGTYDGEKDDRFPELAVDMLSELPPLAAKRGIDIIPVVTSLTLPGLNSLTDKPNKQGFSLDSIQLPADRTTKPQVFHTYVPDPLRPETQRWLIRHLVEIAQRSHQYGNVPGIGFRVNGKIGTCYTSGEDKSSGETKVVSASGMGYTKWHYAQFKKDIGLKVPTDLMEGYEWLKSDPKRWDAWLNWRCERTRQFWLRARDAIKRVDPNLTLYVLTDLPAETSGTNIEWPGADDPNALATSRDLLRYHGFDPEMFKNDEGIVIQRIMMTEMERLFSKWGPPWGTNHDRYRDFHEQDELARWYRTPAGSAVEVYRTYWEEAYHPEGEFGFVPGKGGMRTATATPIGRAFYRPITRTLRAANNDMIVMTGWQRALLGHEHDLQRLAQAFRALPTADPVELKTSADNTNIVAGWYDDRLGIINDTDQVATITVMLDKPLQAGHKLVDVADGRVYIDADAAKRDELTIDLLEYDVRTLAVEGR